MPRLPNATRRPASTPEPAILQDADLRDGLARRRTPGGVYDAPEPTPDRADLSADDARLMAALRRWKAAPPDPLDAEAVGRALAGSFPGSRVDAAAYAAGLAALAEDDAVDPHVLRHVARRIRAECRSLPPIAEVRERAIAERRARERLLFALDGYGRAWAAAAARELQVAERIAARAADQGCAVAADDVVLMYRALASDEEWLHERNQSPPRNDAWIAEWAIRELDRGGPVAARAAALVPAIAEAERARSIALAEARARLADLPQDAPEWQEWDRAWPNVHSRFRVELSDLAEALGLTIEPDDDATACRGDRSAPQAGPAAGTIPTAGAQANAV
jgi:hypothetical protein